MITVYTKKTIIKLRKKRQKQMRDYSKTSVPPIEFIPLSMLETEPPKEVLLSMSETEPPKEILLSMSETEPPKEILLPMSETEPPKEKCYCKSV
jgi:hypothetical protein